MLKVTKAAVGVKTIRTLTDKRGAKASLLFHTASGPSDAPRLNLTPLFSERNTTERDPKKSKNMEKRGKC